MNKNLIVTVITAFLINGSLWAAEGVTEAKEYHNNSKIQQHWALESLKNFPLDRNDKVLDVGCGEGKITARIAEEVPKGIVVGLDVSKEMIAYAAKNYSENNLFFIEGSADTSSFNEQFDKVVSFNALHWVLDQKRALKSIKQSLKDGGRLLIVVPGKSKCNVGYVAEELVLTNKWAPLFNEFAQQRAYFNAEEYLVLLNELKFEVKSIQEFESFSSFKNRDLLMKFYKPLLNFIDHLTKEQQRDFLNDFADKLISYSNVSSLDGSIGVPLCKLEVIARKPR